LDPDPLSRLHTDSGTQAGDALERPEEGWSAVGVSRVIDRVRPEIDRPKPVALGVPERDRE
jgi:hypothetical protein